MAQPIDMAPEATGPVATPSPAVADFGSGWERAKRLIATRPGERDILDDADRLDFERLLQWLRLSLFLAPFLVVSAFGLAAAGYAVLIAALVLASYGWIWALLRYAPHLLLRHQVALRVLDCGLVCLIIANYHAFLGNAYYDAVYILFVVAAAATHGRRGALTIAAIGGLLVLVGRLYLIGTGVVGVEARHFSDSAFYLLFFSLVGLAVAFLMRKSGEVVERRERIWRAEMAKRNRDLEHIAAQLRASNTELEAFAYSVSHDLRAPLRGIDGFSRVLLQKYSDVLDEAGQDYLHRVRAASQRMAALIDDLLKLSRVTRSEMRREAVDLSALARTILDDLRQQQPDRTVDIRIAGGLVERGDPVLLRQLLENLLANAWKFTSPRPKATIEFGGFRQNGESVYFVRDNGVGFDMTYADKLFGAFQRLHGATEFEGTGIGLATVQRIITRHGGRVWAEAAVDHGATFYFSFPGSDGERSP